MTPQHRTVPGRASKIQNPKSKIDDPKSKIQNPKSIALIFALVCTLTTFPLRADTLTFTGSSIAMRGCTVQTIQGGQVSYTDSRGQRQRRPIEQIAAIGFDGLPDLDQAEAAMATEDFNAALPAMLRAANRASNDVQRLWVHARLSRLHDLRREYVPAAGHAATVFALSDDVAWRSLRPVSEPQPASVRATREALHRLQLAAKEVKSTELQREIDAMLRIIQPLFAAIDAPASDAVTPASTTSGFTLEEALALSSTGAATTRPRETPATNAATAPSLHQAASAPQPAAGDSNDAASIDQLLARQQWGDAIAACEAIASDPGPRDLGQFLHQYGQALSGGGRPREAIIMLTRSAILYPDSPHARLAFIDAAVIYRDEFSKPETSRRLLERAIPIAEAQSDAATAMLAREILQTIPAN